MCFSVNFPKRLGTPFLKNTSVRMLLIYATAIMRQHSRSETKEKRRNYVLTH